MRISRVGWLGLAVGLLNMGPGPGFRERYQALMRQHKTKEAEAVVKQWARAAPHDPDLYVARYNLLMESASTLALSTKPAAAGELEIKDQQTGAPVGSLGAGYNPVVVQQAIDVLTEGLKWAPDRLDMRFGQAYAAQQVQDDAQEYKILSAALAWRQSAAGRAWRWRDGGVLPRPEAQFVPTVLEGYLTPYWQGESAEGYKRGLAIAALLVRYYPKSSLGYFNTGACYAFTGDDAQAYKWFQQADALNPDDPQNVNNLLRLGLNLKDKVAAQGYLTRLCRYPDFKEECQHYTDELNKL